MLQSRGRRLQLDPGASSSNVYRSYHNKTDCYEGYKTHYNGFPQRTCCFGLGYVLKARDTT